MSYKVTIRDQSQAVLTTKIGMTVEATLTAAAKEVEAGEDERVRIGVSESSLDGIYSEIFYAHGYGIKDAVKQARAMDRKSRRGGGR